MMGKLMAPAEKAIVRQVSDGMLLLATGAEQGKSQAWCDEMGEMLMAALEHDAKRLGVTDEARVSYLWEVAWRFGSMRCDWHGKPSRFGCP